MPDLDDVSSGLNPKWAVCLLAVIALALVSMLYLSAEQRALRACEEAIKRQLKAPTTYKRVSYVSIPENTPPSVYITYDAANSFGAPIRGTDHCYLTSDLQSATVGYPGPDLPS